MENINFYLWAVTNKETKCFANCLEEGVIKIDGRKLNNFLEYEDEEEMIDHYIEITGKERANSFAKACFTFSGMQEGGIIIAGDKIGGTSYKGYKVLSWGVVTSDYIYDKDAVKYQHFYKVKWHKTEPKVIMPKACKSFMKVLESNEKKNVAEILQINLS